MRLKAWAKSRWISARPPRARRSDRSNAASGHLTVRVFVVGLVAGIAWLQQQAELPTMVQIAGLLFLGVTAVLAASQWQKSALAGRRNVALLATLGAAMVLGVGWAAGRAHLRLADALAPENEGRDIVVEGVVSGLPQAMERGVRFEFQVSESSHPVPPHFSLAWYRSERDDSIEPPGLGGLGRDTADGPAPIVRRLPVRAGERWRFTVRLKRPHGNLNPHGFDYEAWLLERGIRATGYVRAKAETAPQRIAARSYMPGSLIDTARESLRDRYLNHLDGHRYGGILVALAIGDQQAIDPPLWDVFARTGITHLMSISGLHVTMLAALSWWLVSYLWRRSSRLPLYVPAPLAGVVGGFLAALVYSLLAGFAVPAQRTLYMLGVVALALLWRREIAPSRVLAVALLLVVMIDPWAVMAAGFWLSFGAVALLFYIGSGRLWRPHWWRDWVRAQWAVTVGSLPALLALFQQFSLVSPLANALAIPLVSLAITPLTLAGAVPGLGLLLYPADALVTGLMQAMVWLAASPWAVWQQAAPPAWAVLLALLGGMVILLPRGFPAPWLGALLFLPLLTVTPMRPGAGSAQVVVLDVGQGLAVHVQTAQHDLLFDTGPAFSAEADSGNRIIVPYLRAVGVRRLETLVVSHQDKDHEGGAASVLTALPIGELLSSLPYEHPLSAAPVRHRDCQSGEHWEWDGVRLRFLHPPAAWGGDGAGAPGNRRQTNALSCVLLVEAGERRLLVTGDIEAAQEAMVLAQLAALGVTGVDVVTVPHHGSHSSSSADFVAGLRAREAIVPVGYRSRFGHPRPEVVARWEAAGSRMHRTDLDGAVSIALGSEGVSVVRERERRRRYWHGR